MSPSLRGVALGGWVWPLSAFATYVGVPAPLEGASALNYVYCRDWHSAKLQLPLVALMSVHNDY